jgi:FAD:protein FMN transferase
MKLVFSLESRVAGLRPIVGLLSLAFLVSCRTASPDLELHRFEFKRPEMGTTFTITLYAREEAQARTASDAAFARIAALEQVMTDYDPDSELMQLCQKPAGQPVRVSEDLFDILQESQRIAELSGGAFDVTIGPLVRQWRRARRLEKLPSPEQVARARASVGWRKLQLDPQKQTVTLTVPNMQLDLGGIAKGYAADNALRVLRQHDCPRALVAASGDIAVGEAPPGRKTWRVAIGAPQERTNLSAHSLQLRNAAVSTSGDAEQYVEITGQRYSHIVDPRTGVGLTNQAQVSVVGRRAMDTDALATAASVLGVREGLRLIEAQPSFAALFQYSSNGTVRTEMTRQFRKFVD